MCFFRSLHQNVLAASIIKIIFLISGFAYSLCCIYTLWILLNLPLYGDELQWKITVSRLFLDGGKLLYLFPGCTQAFLLGVPITWYPARLLDAMIFGDASDPFYLRQYAFWVFIVLLLTWIVIARYCARLSWRLSFLWVSAFFMVGILPLLMVYNRPEQSLLICISIAIVFGIGLAHKPPQKDIFKIGVWGCFALLGCLIAAAHPKGIYFLPVLLVIYWRITPQLWGNLALISIYALTALDTIALWKVRTKCPESEWLTAMLQGFTVQPKLLKSNPSLFFEIGTNNLQNWTQYIKSVTFVGSPYNYFLNPDLQLSWLDQFASNWVALPIFIVALCMVLNGLQCLFNFYHQGKRTLAIGWLSYGVLVAVLLLIEATTRWGILGIALGIVLGIAMGWRSKTQSTWMLACVLAFSLMILMFMQSLKNFYEATLVWPLILLISLFTFTRASTWAIRTLKYCLLPILLLTAIVQTQWRWDVMGVTPLSWQETRQKIVADNLVFKQFAKEACGIDDQLGLEENLILDDETYPIFWRHARPMLTAYVYGWWSQGTDYKKTLDIYEPQGLATKCNSAPPELLPYLKQTKDFCCASKAALKAFQEINRGKSAK